jgi:hypothetical protein
MTAAKDNLSSAATTRARPSMPTSVHIVDATKGPLVGQGRLDRIMPFAATVEGTDSAHANLLAERIESALKLPYLAAPGMPFSASVGVAHSVDVGAEVEAVLSAADVSMFTRKREQHRADGLDAVSRPVGA